MIVKYHEMAPRTGWSQRYEIPYERTNLDHLDYNISTADVVWREPHQHHEMEEYWFILSGSMRVYQGDQVTKVGADTLIVHERGVWHRAECDDRCEWLCLSFSPRFAPRMRQLMEEQGSYGNDEGAPRPANRTILTPADLPPMEDHGCQRFPTDRRTRDIDHWDINTWKPYREWRDGHQHDDMEEYWYIAEGSARVYQGKVLTRVGPHDLIIHPPGVVHRMETDAERCRWYCIMLNSWLAGPLRDLLAPADPE